MNDAVSRVLSERHELDGGAAFGGVLAVIGHTLLAALVIVFALRPDPPPLQIVDVVPMPMGDSSGSLASGSPGAMEPAPVAKAGRFTRRSFMPAAATRLPGAPQGGVASSSPDDPAVGSVPGVLLGDPIGDPSANSWYLAGVRTKIWSVWVAQTPAEFANPPVVEFTITKDGSLRSVEIVQSSGVVVMDLAAKRAIYSAAPFAPLPANVEREEMQVRAVFRP